MVNLVAGQVECPQLAAEAEHVRAQGVQLVVREAEGGEAAQPVEVVFAQGPELVVADVEHHQVVVVAEGVRLYLINLVSGEVEVFKSAKEINGKF